MEQIRQALAQLGEIGGDSLVHDVVEMFFEEAPNRLSEASKAMQAGDAKSAMRAAHSLKSTSSQLGLDNLSAVCGTMESVARAGELSRFAMLLAEAEGLSVGAMGKLRKVMQAGLSPA